MTQRERDRLVALKKAKKKAITQRQAAEELEISERQVRRLLKRLEQVGDAAVIHGLKGKPSNRRIPEETKKRIIALLSAKDLRDYGPTLASEYLQENHIVIGREALRKLMAAAGLWRPRARTQNQAHRWRERRSRFGELVQWDTSDHDWLEGRGEQIYLIHMIDDATSRLKARFVRHDSTAENMGMLETWLRQYGRPLAVYTDRDTVFHTTPKRIDGEDRKQMPPTQIGRALQELQIAAIKAYSPQAKGRVERSFETAQDRLVKGMRRAGVRTIEEANRYLEQHFLPWWEANCTVQPACPDDAHRPLGKTHDLAAILSYVESRKVVGDYTFRLDGKVYRIEDVVPGLRGNRVRVERRRDGTLAIAFRSRYLRFVPCPSVEKAQPSAAAHRATRGKPRRRSTWMDGFDLHKSPPIWTVK